MASGGLIGALRITLGIDTSEFIAGTGKARAEMRSFQRSFDKMGKKWQSVGRDLSTYVTLPIIGAGVAIAKMAGDFQASMNQVGINANATTKELAAMREQALNIGKDTSKSASEAADAMNMLAKTGMSAADILNGGAKAAVNLAIATGSQLDPATAAISDTMKQFHKIASDLPTVVNQITGAVNESKFSFDDFQMGMGQSGAIAAATGISFQDFTTALAGTASMFQSGSDAGTSFKTFLQHTIPQTKIAAGYMEKYGLSFYDASGKMKSMADIAQMLKEKLGGLSAEDRNQAMTKIFGTDGIRTAIGLMDLGAKGFEEMQARIAGTDAVKQAEVRMAGFNGQLEQLKGAVETLAIRIADSGFLEALTGIINKISEWVDWLGQASPATLKWITIIAGVAAALGPLAMIFGTFFRTVGFLLPLLMKLGPLFQIITTAMGYLLPVLVGLGRAMMVMMLNPIGLVITALGLLYLAWKNWDKIKPIIVALYNTVKEYVLDALGKVWDKVKAKIDAVAGWFYGLYDAVVGHSYIPDMVDEIGQHMARLQKNLVEPAQKGAAAAKQAFQQLQQDVSSILDRLFPEEAKGNQFLKELELLEAGMKRMGFTADQTAEAVKRLREEYHGKSVLDEAPTVVDKLEPTGKPGEGADWEKIKKMADEGMGDILKSTTEKTAEMAVKWAEMARDAVGSMRNMVDAFKSGDILGGITGILDLITQVAGVIGGLSGKPAIPTFSREPRAPGFSTTGSFKVGGSGGVDSQMVRLRATPGEMIDVRRGNQSRQQAIVVYVKKGEMFDAHVARVAVPIAQQAGLAGAAAGSQMAESNMSKANRNAMA